MMRENHYVYKIKIVSLSLKFRSINYIHEKGDICNTLYNKIIFTNLCIHRHCVFLQVDALSTEVKPVWAKYIKNVTFFSGICVL